MEEYNQLEESIKKLPKYSLDYERKKKIVATLRTQSTSKKKPSILIPVISIVAISFLLVFLILTKDYNKLSAQQGTTFTLPDRNQNVVGIEGKVGILVYKEQFVAEDWRRGAKLMLYYWGNQSALVGKNYKVEAESMEGDKIELSRGKLSSGLNSEDAHTLASFEPFPNEGKWQLFFYVDDNLFETFTIDVLPPFPKTEHYMLNDSPKEIPVGEAYEISIESIKGDKKNIEVKLLNRKGDVEEVTVFEQQVTAIDARSFQNIYYYSGEITLEEQGTWKLLIDGEETGLFEN